MYAFLSKLRPRSVNAKKSEEYQHGLARDFRSYHAEEIKIDGNLYGVTYYFHKGKTELDADNLSKPIWDALESIAYVDDKLIKFRTSGVFDLRSEPIEVLDLSNIPDYLFSDFLEMIEKEDHILYVEFGKLNYSLFSFAYEK